MIKTKETTHTEWVELICRMCGDTKNIIKTDITYITLVGHDNE